MKHGSYIYQPDVHLLDQVGRILLYLQVPDFDFIRANMSPDIYHVDHNLQRQMINRFLRIHLGLYQENTILVRSALIDDGCVSDWLRLFELEVAPCLRRNHIQLKTS